jgi:hypothetical protein
MRKRQGGSHISGFQGSKLHEFRCPNININTLSKMRKRKGGSCISRISGFETSRVPVSKHQHEQTSEMRKERKVRPVFQDFRVRNFVPVSKYQHKQTFENAKNKGSNISGFQDSGFRGFKCQTTTYNNS